MSQYLVFQLHGPMASWGENAPGEVRHTSPLPSRSALLGLVAAALGIRRDDKEKLAVLHRHYQFLFCSSARPRWARDYHTVQMPKEVRKKRYFCRREELLDPAILEALITKRDYYTDAWWVVAVAMTESAPYRLDELLEALRHPVFPLYLGRKSHPLALPLDPQIVEGNAAQVLSRSTEHYQSKMSQLAGALRSLNAMSSEYWWEGEHEGLHKQQTLSRRDQPVDRERWLFTERTYFKGIALKEETCISQK